MVRRVDPNAEALVWCRRCSVPPGPELMNRCSPDKKDSKEYGRMLKRILKLEGGKFPHRNARGSEVEGETNRVTRKECKVVGNNLQTEVSWHKKRVVEKSPRRGCWKTEERCLERKAQKSEETRPSIHEDS